jgi:hypothetical protein
MYDYQRDDYKVISYIKRHLPQHLEGYRKGWLKTEQIDTYNAIHIYSKINGSWKIIGTVL